MKNGTQTNKNKESLQSQTKISTQSEPRSELPRDNFQKPKTEFQEVQSQTSETITGIATQYREAKALKCLQGGDKNLQLSPDQPRDIYNDSL